MKKIIKLAALISAALLLLGQANKKPGDVTLILDCIKTNEKTPKMMFGGYHNKKVLEQCCTSRLFDTNVKAVFIRLEDDIYKANEHRTWLKPSHIQKYNTLWLSYLAGAKPDLHIIESDIPGILLFAGRFGSAGEENYALWAWKFNQSDPDEQPEELKVADLLSGDRADEDLVQYLHDPDNLKESGIYKILAEWSADSNKGYTVVEILGEDCVHADPTVGAYNCKDRIEDGPRIFTSAENHANQLPDCTNSSLRNSQLLNLLLRDKAGNYKVYEANSQQRYPAEIAGSMIGDVDQLDSTKRAQARYMAWMTILCFSNCRTILEEDSSHIIVGCDEKIIAYNKITKERYLPVDLIDQANTQKQFVSNYNMVNGYRSSMIKKLFDNWKNSGEKLVIRAFTDSNIGYNGEFTGLHDKLKESIRNGNPHRGRGTINFLLKNESSSSYYWLSSDKPVNQKEPSWYNQSSTVNHHLALLAAWRNDIHKLTALPSSANSGSFFSFTTQDSGKEQLWTWKISGEDSVTAYACFQDLWPTNNNIDLSHSIASELKEMDPRFSGNFKRVAETMGVAKLRQAFPVERHSYSGEYSPLVSLGFGATTSSTGGETMPPYLSSNLNDVTQQLQLLVEGGDSELYLYPPTGRVALVEAKWADLMRIHRNPWLAWLYMSDTEKHIIAYDSTSSNLVRFCFLAPRDASKNLWAWVDEDMSQEDIGEYKLIDGTKPFLWSDRLQKEYTALLQNDVSTEEKRFFLNYANRPDELELVDLFDLDSLNHLLTWRNPKSPSSHKLYRVGSDIAHPEPGIEINLVDGRWDDTWSTAKERYSQTWYRSHFYAQIARSVEYPLYAWLGETKLGVSIGANYRLGVFSNNRNFGYLSLGEIIRQVDGYDFIPMSPMSKSNANKPTMHNLFNAFVANQGEWNKVDSLWRTNPIGYFD